MGAEPLTRRRISLWLRGAFLFSFLQKPIRPIRLIRGRTEISRGQVFILVYRLAMDAKTLRGDGVAG